MLETHCSEISALWAEEAQVGIDAHTACTGDLESPRARQEPVGPVLQLFRQPHWPLPSRAPCALQCRRQPFQVEAAWSVAGAGALHGPLL